MIEGLGTRLYIVDTQLVSAVLQYCTASSPNTPASIPKNLLQKYSFRHDFTSQITSESISEDPKSQPILRSSLQFDPPPPRQCFLQLPTKLKSLDRNSGMKTNPGKRIKLGWNPGHESYMYGTLLSHDLPYKATFVVTFGMLVTLCVYSPQQGSECHPRGYLGLVSCPYLTRKGSGDT